jgi:hypothetical protein
MPLTPDILLWLIPVVVVDTALKAWAAWHAARRSQLVWFILLFIVNSAGILPLIYLVTYGTGKKKK